MNVRDFTFFLSYVLATCIPLTLFQTARNFEYEGVQLFAWFTLLLVPLAAASLPITQLKLENRKREFLRVFVWGPLFPILVAGSFFASGACACSERGYLFWFFVNALPTWLFAHACAGWVMQQRLRGWGRLRSLGSVYLFDLAALAYAVFLLWTHPQKRLVSFFFGFLHGPVYDDWIVVDAGILVMRATQALIAGGFYFYFCFTGQVRKLVSLLAELGVITSIILCYLFPSTSNDPKTLQALLPDVKKGQGFTLHYAKPAGTAANAAERSAEILWQEASFHIEELSTIFSGPHVDIYAYPDEDSKKLWFGGGGTDVTDVSTPSVHITLGDWPHLSLRHELVHALSSNLAFHGLGFHPNMAFTEGLAVALAPEKRYLSLHEEAVALLRAQKLPPLKDLFTPLFWQSSGPRAYTAAGSLVQFIIETFGVEKLKALYAGAAIAEVLPYSEDELLRRWEEHISKFYDEEKMRLYGEALYRNPGVFLDVCPHSRADQLRAHDGSPFVSWRRATHELPPPPPPPEELRRLDQDLTRSDELRSTEQARSLEILTALRDFTDKHLVPEGFLRLIWARLAVEELGPEQAPAWRHFLAGTGKIPEELGLHGEDAHSKEPWILVYLKLRQASSVQPPPTRTLRALAAIKPDTHLPTSFHKEWYNLLAEGFFQHKELVNAERFWLHAAETAPSGQRAFFRQMAHFAHFLGR